MERFSRDHPYGAWFLFSAVALGLFHGVLLLQGGMPSWDDSLPRMLRLVYLLLLASFAALAVVKWLMALEWAPLAVACTVVDEALRMKIAVVFVGVLLVCLAALPFSVDASSSALRYRVQTLIHYGLTATGALLSLMTVFLACGTLSLEIQDLRIFTTLSKPISRGQYLLGKWIGLLMLNTALLLVAGCAIHLTVEWVASRQALDKNDQERVNEEVLTARVSVKPEPPQEEFEQRVRERLDRIKRDAPKEFGSTLDEQREKEEQVREDVEKQWWSIAPQRSGTYVFRGLKDARQGGMSVQIRFNLHYIGRWDEMNEQGLRVWRTFESSGHRIRKEIVLGRYQTLEVPASFIDDNGELRLTLYNSDPDDPNRMKNISLVFVHKVGLEALYKADSFTFNFWRAVAMLWIKLAFLSILGLSVATFLGFPVACLMSMVILVAAWISGYLMVEIHRYGEGFESTGAQGMAWVVRSVVRFVAGVLQQYSRFAPATQVADGRLVPWSDLWSCFFWVGIVWCGVTGLVGWVIFRIREVGRIQV